MARRPSDLSSSGTKSARTAFRSMPEAMATSKRKQEQEGEELEEAYKIPSGIMATILEADQVTGLERGCRRGVVRARGAVTFKALAINISIPGKPWRVVKPSVHEPHIGGKEGDPPPWASRRPSGPQKGLPSGGSSRPRPSGSCRSCLCTETECRSFSCPHVSVPSVADLMYFRYSLSRTYAYSRRTDSNDGM